ncbi:MAG TPA: AMIN domain-containing protein, partial [Gemmatimonadaceae bacterium]|nr:AMIN domain-containing protein [Gemmatimonadaceae bacterium]
MSFFKALPAAALLFLPSSAVTVHSLSVVPSSGKAEVVIGVNAAVDVQDFTLDAPDRVVVDLKGATLDMSRQTYDKAWRGGITNIRYSQFRPGIVRVVIELDAKHPYEVKRSDREVRISVTGGKTTDYSAWPSSESRDSYAAAPRAATVRAPSVARVDAAKTRVASAPARVYETASAKAVVQVESSIAQPDQQYDPAPPAAQPEASRIASTYNAKPIALFSQVQQSQQAPITVTFQDTDIRDVIASFAAFAGRTIVVGKDVSGTVTAEVKNQP